MVSIAQIVANSMPPLPVHGLRTVVGVCHADGDEDFAPVADFDAAARPAGLSDRAWFLRVLRGADAPLCSRDFGAAGFDQHTASALLSWACREKLAVCLGVSDRAARGGRRLQCYVASEVAA